MGGTVRSVNGKEADEKGNVQITIPAAPVLASQAEAEVGTNNTKHMTPLRTAQAIAALVDVGNPIVALSVSGRTITYTKKDGSTGTINTQDTNTSNWTVSKGTNGWARDNTTGFTIQWGTGEQFTFGKNNYATPKDCGTVTITLPRALNTYFCGSITYKNGKNGPSMGSGHIESCNGATITVRNITSVDSGSGGGLYPVYIVFGIS